MKKPKMTMNEVITDMRERGFAISQKRFKECVLQGVFPFATVFDIGGQRRFFIFRKDYEAWANDYLGGYEQ